MRIGVENLKNVANVCQYQATHQHYKRVNTIFFNRIIDPLSNLKKDFNFPFCNQLFKAQDTLSYWFLVPQHHALKAFSLGSETTVKKSRG